MRKRKHNTPLLHWTAEYQPYNPELLFFFHRGLPFSKRGHTHNLHEYTCVRTYASTVMRNVSIQIIQVKVFTSPKPFCVRAHFQHRSRGSSRIRAALCRNPSVTSGSECFSPDPVGTTNNGPTLRFDFCVSLKACCEKRENRKVEHFLWKNGKYSF